MQKTLLVILDGLGDRPVKSLGGKTPLEAACTPNMDKMVSDGICGTMNAMPKNLYPTSEESHLAILGYDFKADYPGRGVLEALGIGIKLKPDELAFRANFATVDNDLNLVDARAGVIDSVKDLAKACNDIEIDNVRFKIYPSLQHRAVLVVSGGPVKKYINGMGSRLHENDKKGSGNGSGLISDTDSHKAGPRKMGVRVLHPKAYGSSKEGKTVARALERYQLLTHEILSENKINKKRIKKGKPPANFIVTRGCGYLKDVEPFSKKFKVKAVCIAGAPLYKGIAAYLGMKVMSVRGATGKLDTNISAKAKAVQKALKKNDFVFLHIKGTDMAAEDYGDGKMKKEFIEKIDKELGRFLGKKNVKIAVTADHSTPCVLKDHSSDPVPVLINSQFTIHNSQSNGQVSSVKFGERECKKGSLGHIYGKDFMRILLKR